MTARDGNLPGVISGLFGLEGVSISGFVSGSFSGMDTGRTTTVNGVSGFSMDDGTYTINSASGVYQGNPMTGTFEVATGPVATPAQGTGEIAFNETLAQGHLTGARKPRSRWPRTVGRRMRQEGSQEQPPKARHTRPPTG